MLKSLYVCLTLCKYSAKVIFNKFQVENNAKIKNNFNNAIIFL